MKSFKNIISLIVLASFVFLIPLKTNALTIEEVIKNLNDLQPSNITNIKDAINYYDYQESIDEISSILDESLNCSKEANEELDELNTLMNSINDKNKTLLTIKDKKEYDSAIDTLKEEVELAKQINSSAKTSSQEGLDKYNEAIEKYASLKSELEDKKAKTEAILNANIMATNAKLDAINSLLEELVKHEDKLKEAFNEANKAYDNAKASATAANTNFVEKLEALKEYVEVNAGDELNDLIEVNTKYITSGILYASSQIALKLIDVEINLVEAEIESLNEELILLDQKLELYKNAVTEKEEDLNELNEELENLTQSLNTNGTVNQIEAQIINAEKYLEELKQSKDEQTKCSEYMPELKAAIEAGNAEEVVKLLLKNEKAYGFTEKNIEVETKKELNSNFEIVDYIIVTDLDSSEEYVYSYKENNGVVTIYYQNYVDEHEVSELTGEITAGKFLAYLDGSAKKIGSININESFFSYNINININGFIANGKYFEVKKENNNWFAIEKTVKISLSGIQLVDGNKTAITVTEAGHYEQGNSNHITSEIAVNKCTALENNTIDTEISLQETLIDALEQKLVIATELEQNITDKQTEKATINEELATAQVEYDNQKAIITNEDGLTYSDIESKIAELEGKLNHYPNSIGDLADLANLKNIINGATQGNVDVKSILETINNLNIGLNHKRTLVELLDKILEKNYNNAKEELKDVVGEDIENISNILNDLAPLITEVAESNLNLVEEKVKYELAKANYDAYLEAKKIILDAKENTLEELEELENLKTENDFDLSDLEFKIKEAEDALVNINNDVEVTINDYVEVKEENTESDNKPTSDNTTETSKSDKNDSSKEEKVEIKDSTEETYEEELENGFNWLNLLWLLPIAIILFFIIFFIKRRKEEE